jgi:hypothetical protein
MEAEEEGSLLGEEEVLTLLEGAEEVLRARRERWVLEVEADHHQHSRSWPREDARNQWKPR